MGQRKRQLVPHQATFAPSRRPARPLAAPAEIPSTSSTRASGRHAESPHRTPLLDGRTLPAAALVRAHARARRDRSRHRPGVRGGRCFRCPLCLSFLLTWGTEKRGCSSVPLVPETGSCLCLTDERGDLGSFGVVPSASPRLPRASPTVPGYAAAPVRSARGPRRLWSVERATG
ncbi:hypothetical protein FEF34_20075 [Streptomyces marianii]|uniref:Uncharacterized protein n=1 Tax=Streptomyces marianii TaxID=1817406 RepID=A0A5R9E8C7_9ACTN|nr:hypothetical protein FEF34_20075 [Streptomyces marianii]